MLKRCGHIKGDGCETKAHGEMEFHWGTSCGRSIALLEIQHLPQRLSCLSAPDDKGARSRRRLQTPWPTRSSMIVGCKLPMDFSFSKATLRLKRREGCKEISHRSKPLTTPLWAQTHATATNGAWLLVKFSQVSRQASDDLLEDLISGMAVACFVSFAKDFFSAEIF